MSKPGPFETLRAAAIIMWREYGAWAYDTWAAHNAAYFADELTPPGIIWGLAPNHRQLGHYQPTYNVITLHVGLLAADEGNLWGLDAWVGQSLAADLLLHAMIHQRLGLGECSINSHNTEEWVAEVNRIAPLLGLPANAQVVPQMRKGQSLFWVAKEGGMRRRELARWPMLSRPEGYPADVMARFGEFLQG